MKQVPYNEWPSTGFDPKRIELWRDGNFLVQVFEEDNDVLRVSVNRVVAGKNAKRIAGITWETLMSIKRQIGRGEKYAVEVLPRDRDIVNVANMRHFWILPSPVCGWVREPAS